MSEKLRANCFRGEQLSIKEGITVRLSGKRIVGSSVLVTEELYSSSDFENHNYNFIKIIRAVAKTDVTRKCYFLDKRHENEDQCVIFNLNFQKGSDIKITHYMYIGKYFEHQVRTKRNFNKIFGEGITILSNDSKEETIQIILELSPGSMIGFTYEEDEINRVGVFYFDGENMRFVKAKNSFDTRITKGKKLKWSNWSKIESIFDEVAIELGVIKRQEMNYERKSFWTEWAERLGIVKREEVNSERNGIPNEEGIGTELFSTEKIFIELETELVRMEEGMKELQESQIRDMIGEIIQSTRKIIEYSRKYTVKIKIKDIGPLPTHIKSANDLIEGMHVVLFFERDEEVIKKAGDSLEQLKGFLKELKDNLVGRDRLSVEFECAHLNKLSVDPRIVK